MTGTTAIGNVRRNRLRPLIWGMAACLLLLPAVAMQFENSGVNWTASDFIVMGALLAIACGLYELGAWLSGNGIYRAAFGIGVCTGFLTVWVNLAVGMLGDEGGVANLMFVVVLLVAASGALVAKLQPLGMARAMFATAIAQLAAAGVGLVMGFDTLEVSLTACFALPWLLSGGLFQKAAQETAASGETA